MKEIISNTPYDDVYRTMIVEDDELVLPLLNEVFGDNYSGKEKIVRYANEHYNIQQDGAEEKRITDSFLEVIGKITPMSSPPSLFLISWAISSIEQ